MNNCQLTSNNPALKSPAEMSRVRAQANALDWKALPSLSAHWALFFDIDGTLAEIASTPDHAFIPVRTLELLHALQVQKIAVALISGRQLASIDHLCRPFRFAAAGQHGLEVRHEDGAIQTVRDQTEALKDAFNRAKLLKQRHPELYIEEKSLSIAIHYRLSPALEPVVDSFVHDAAERQPQILSVQEGKMVRELRLRGGNKGTAIMQFLQQSPFIGKTPVFIGDDVTDEDGFAAVNRVEGISIKIGEGESSAQYRLANVNQLQEWLMKMVNVRQEAGA